MSKARDDVRTRNSGARHVDARAILRDPAVQRQMIDAEAARAGRRPMQSERDADGHAFTCPQCGGHAFGTDNMSRDPSEWVVRCQSSGCARESSDWRAWKGLHRDYVRPVWPGGVTPVAEAPPGWSEGRAPVAEQGAEPEQARKPRKHPDCWAALCGEVECRGDGPCYVQVARGGGGFVPYPTGPNDYVGRPAAPPLSEQEREDEAWLEEEIEGYTRAGEEEDAKGSGSPFFEIYAARYRRILAALRAARLRAAPAPPAQGSEGLEALARLGADVKAWCEDLSNKARGGFLSRPRDSHGATMVACGLHCWNIYDLACTAAALRAPAPAPVEGALREATWFSVQLPVSGRVDAWRQTACIPADAVGDLRAVLDMLSGTGYRLVAVWEQRRVVEASAALAALTPDAGEASDGQ